jgi:hypothetical protein
VKPLENPHHLANIIFHEFESVRKDLQKDIPFFIKLKYLFMPPGWSHDGSTRAATELRKELVEEETSLAQQPSLVHG